MLHSKSAAATSAAINLLHTISCLSSRRLNEKWRSETAVDVRIILKEALLKLATSVILCHNHPSGNIRPSGNDDSFTKHFNDAAKLMNITLLDHIIVTSDNYYSYADEGRI